MNDRSCVETQRPRERAAKHQRYAQLRRDGVLSALINRFLLSLASVTGAGIYCGTSSADTGLDRDEPAAPHPAPVARERPTWFATEPSVDDVVAAVDVKRLAGDQLRRIHGEECHRHANVLDRHQATRRSFRLRLLQ